MDSATAAELQLPLNGPAGSPPAGTTPNLINSPRLRTASIVIMTVGLALSTLAVLMRMYTKAFLIRSVWYEDCKSDHRESPAPLLMKLR